jgi:hypothetical protein
MAGVNYLKGGERAGAKAMTALFEAFDAKLSNLFYGKSFLLGQFSTMPSRLMGKCFFFTSGSNTATTGSLLYSIFAPGTYTMQPAGTDPNGNPYASFLTVPNYNHAFFMAKQAALAKSVLSWDEKNHIATIATIPDADYGTPNYAVNPPDPGVGFFENCLSRAFVLHQGANDDAPVPYYILEQKAYVPPERKYTLGLAEIIMEGVASVTIPDTYDKYDCFRVHNLNGVSGRIKFGNVTTTLGAFGCKTFRRDSSGQVQPTGLNYFFPFRHGDPRFYWFMGRSFDWSNEGDPYMGADALTSSNSMCGNNLANPAIVFQWVDYYASRSGNTPYWVTDPLEMNDISEHYKKQFGDPSKPSTILGDLIHHQGEIKIVRVSRTQKHPENQYPVLSLDSVQFRGYATIVQDFAAKLLKVAEDNDGNLVISNVDPDNYVVLIPISTNLFKDGESLPVMVFLDNLDGKLPNYQGTGGGPFTIENAIFENPDGPNAPLVSSLTREGFALNISQDSRSYYDIRSAANDPAYEDPIVVLGPSTLSSTGVSDSSAVLNGIHKLHVSDLTDLSFFVNTSQDGASYSDVNLILTWQGLVLTFNRQRVDYPEETLKFQFRGHGWGYYDPTLANYGVGWLSPRAGRRYTTGGIKDATTGGDDFKLSDLGGGQSKVSLLGRVLPDAMDLSDSRFWHILHQDGLLALLGLCNGLGAADADMEFWIDQSGTLQEMHKPIAMALLPEMYNALAAAVNSVKSGNPLSYACLRWWVNGKIMTFPNPWDNLYNNLPVPMDYFCCIPPHDDGDPLTDLEGLMAALGIPLKTTADFPPEYAANLNTPGGGGALAMHKTTVRYKNPICSYTFGQQAPGSIDVIWYVVWNISGCHTEVSVETLDSTAYLSLTGGGPGWQGVHDRGSDPPTPSGLGQWWTLTPPNGSDYLIWMATGAGDNRQEGGLEYSANVVLPPCSTQPGVAARSNGAVDLNNDYADFQWIAISDVKRALEAYGFGFCYYQVCVPLRLAVFGDESNLATNIFDWSVDSADSPWPGQYTEQWGFDTLLPPFGSGDPRPCDIVIEQASIVNLADAWNMRFVPVTTTVDASWKIPVNVMAGTQTIPIFGTAAVYDLPNHTSAHYNALDYVCPIDPGTAPKADGTMPRDEGLDFSDWGPYAFIMSEQVGGSTSDLRRLDDLFQSVAVQFYATGLNSTLYDGTITLQPVPAWRDQPDYWAGGGQQFMQYYYTGVPGMPRPPQDYVTPGGAVTVQAVNNGLTIIPPPKSPCFYQLIVNTNNSLIAL